MSFETTCLCQRGCFWSAEELRDSWVTRRTYVGRCLETLKGGKDDRELALGGAGFLVRHLDVRNRDAMSISGCVREVLMLCSSWNVAKSCCGAGRVLKEVYLRAGKWEVGRCCGKKEEVVNIWVWQRKFIVSTATTF